MVNVKDTHASRRNVIEAYPEKANLYPLTVEPMPDELFALKHLVRGRMREEVYFERAPGTSPVEVTIGAMRRAIQRAVLAGLKAANYTLSSHSQKIIKKDSNLAPSAVGRSIQIYSSFDWQILHFNSNYYLCLDHRLVVRATLALARLLQMAPGLGLNPHQRIYYKLDGEWGEGKLLGSGPFAMITPRLVRRVISTAR
jgi:hypothetical protein